MLISVNTSVGIFHFPYDICLNVLSVRFQSGFFLTLSGLVVLKELSISVEKYYASEIDETAILVSKARHGEDIQHIGCVTEISSQTVSSTELLLAFILLRR